MDISEIPKTGVIIVSIVLIAFCTFDLICCPKHILFLMYFLYVCMYISFGLIVQHSYFLHLCRNVLNKQYERHRSKTRKGHPKLGKYIQTYTKRTCLSTQEIFPNMARLGSTLHPWEKKMKFSQKTRFVIFFS